MNTLTRWAAAALIVGLCSLSQARAEEVIRLHIDPTASMYERARILQAISEWNVAGRDPATGAQVFRFELTPHDGIGIVFSGLGVSYRGRAADARAIGPAGGDIVVYVSGASLTPEMRHELGHRLGLMHTPGTVMDPYCCATMQAIDPASASLARYLSKLRQTTALNPLVTAVRR